VFAYIFSYQKQSTKPIDKFSAKSYF